MKKKIMIRGVEQTGHKPAQGYINAIVSAYISATLTMTLKVEQYNKAKGYQTAVHRFWLLHSFYANMQNCCLIQRILVEFTFCIRTK
jgi:hypothetical protein